MLSPVYFDDWWILKFLIFGSLMALLYTETVSGEVFDHHGYAWFARLGGFLFIMLQQVILLDFAMSWSEKWVGVFQGGERLDTGFRPLGR